jgi:hypothetical protein
VARPATVLFALVSSTFVAFGWVADRALEGQIRRAQEDAGQAAAETARLTALSVRAVLASLESRVLAQATPGGVSSERLPIAPAAAAPPPDARPYRSRPRAELARLLHSTSSSPSGLPEAVLARLALGDAATVLLIAPPQQLPTRRHFSGQRIDVDLHDADLRKALAELTARGGLTVELDPVVEGRVTIRLNQVRCDQALDVVVAVNGLDWARDGDVVKVFPRQRP